MGSWSAQPIFGSYVIVALITAALLSLLVVRPTFHSLGRSQQRVLVGLRIALIALLLVAMLRPTCVRSLTRPRSTVLLLLVDATRSMTLPHASEGKSRWDVQQETLARASAELESLSRRFSVRCYTYDSELNAVELQGGKLLLPPRPEGGQTDIGSTLYEAIRRESGNWVGGVLLLGDGTQTAIAPRVELTEAGRELKRLDCPLITVPFGPAGDLSQARDIAVENLPEQYTVFVKNELLVRGQLRVRGYVNKEIPVELIVEDARGTRQRVAQRSLSVAEDGNLAEIRVPYVPQAPGQYRLVLRAEPQPGELVTKNNELSAFLTVLEGGLKVLYLAEWPAKNEMRFLFRAINKSPDIEQQLFKIDPQSPQTRPRPEELTDPTVDVVMIGDVDATALGDENLKALEQMVAKGKGLIMLGGWHSFGPGGYRGTPLADVLPIVMERFERQDFGAPDRMDLHLANDPANTNDMRLVPARPHPITELGPADAGANMALWRQLPELEGVNKFAEIKEAAGTRVLLETPTRAPVLVAGEYGQGRVLAFAGDSTWRWVMGENKERSFEREHRRFWRQVVLWLAKRDDLGKQDVWIKLPQRRFQPGARVEWTTGAATTTGDPIPDATLAVEVVRPDGTRQALPLAASATAQAEFNGAIPRVAEPGTYTVEVMAKRGEQAIGSARADFQVLDQDLELASPAADPDQLARLANLTAESGGKTIAPEELPGVLRQLEQRPPQTNVVVESKWQLADTWWDAWLFFAIVVGVYSAEWGLRKKWGLV